MGKLTGGLNIPGMQGLLGVCNYEICFQRFFVLNAYPQSVIKLISEFGKMPGIGQKQQDLSCLLYPETDNGGGHAARLCHP